MNSVNTDATKALIIIDDDNTFREVLQRRLAQHTDYQIQAYASSQDALAVEPPSSTHVVLLDMMLEDESGLDAIIAMKQHFSPAHLIMLTGYASIATTVEAMRRGATDYIAKPVGLQELIQRISDGAVISLGSHTLEEAKPMTPAQVEWEHIQRVLLENEGNISATAEALGMHRRSLQRKLQKHSPSKK
ncbi:MAG: response regulator [Thalassolituus sp.]|jgi:two-component system response regulator RegA